MAGEDTNKPDKMSDKRHNDHVTSTSNDINDDLKTDTPSASRGLPQPIQPVHTSESATSAPATLISAHYSSDSSSLPSKSAKANKPHARNNSGGDHEDYNTIDPNHDTELAEEPIHVDAKDAEESFEVLPPAKKLRRGSELEGNGRPFAGEVAHRDAMREEEQSRGGAEEGKEGKNKKFWSREGKAEDTGK